jgi:uncharacterized protein YdhG (YjbR/CyaY superfamily)
MAQKAATKSGTKARGSGLTAGEKAAMLETIRERKANLNKEEAEKAVVAAIAKMAPSDRAMAKRFHDLVKATAPELAAKTWYGMPAYTNKDGKVVCFFKGAAKFKSRYATIGFEDAANLDDGKMWPTSYALEELTAADEAKLRAIVKKAAG